MIALLYSCSGLEHVLKLYVLWLYCYAPNSARASAQIEGEALGDAFNGYIFKITGGNDKQVHVD